MPGICSKSSKNLEFYVWLYVGVTSYYVMSHHHILLVCGPNSSIYFANAQYLICVLSSDDLLLLPCHVSDAMKELLEESQIFDSMLQKYLTDRDDVARRAVEE